MEKTKSLYLKNYRIFLKENKTKMERNDKRGQKMRYEALRKEFEKQFPIPKGNSKKPYIILFDGYTGMGKSTVSSLIAKYEKVIILNNDEVRKFLNDYNDQTGLKDKLQKYRLEKLLEENNNCICDSCFCHNYEEKLRYYKSLGYKYYIIRLECSDETVKERLSQRTLNKTNASIADYQGYLWMKQNVERVPLNLIDFTINTEIDLEPQVQKLVEMIRNAK